MFSASKFIDFFVHDILDYTLLNKDQKNFIKNPKVVNIMDAIDEIVDILKDKIELKEIHVVKEFLGLQKSDITIDVKRMQQVFLNLISNAVKFTDREGKIKIQVIKQHKHIKMSVTDNGLGIKEQDKDKLFKLFGSIKSEKKKINTNGIGLGLVISKLITNKYGGEIDFDSEYKKGSTFWFTFEVEDDKNGPQEIVHPKRRSSLDLKKGVVRLKSSELVSGVKVTPQNYQ
jgi:signal transduction histidine kinase